MTKKNKKNIIFIVIILALVGYILFDKGVFANIDFKTDKKEQVFVPEGEVENKTVATTSNTQIKTETPKPITDNSTNCEAQVLKEVTDKNIKYTKGAVLVSFVTSVSFNEAKTIVTDLDYTIVDEATVKARFEPNERWFVAKVGTGHEFEAICTLRENSDVKYVWIEPIWEIHE